MARRRTYPVPKVTVTKLRRARACDEEVRLFQRTFPKGMPLTVQNLECANNAHLNTHWLYCRLTAVFGRKAPFIRAQRDLIVARKALNTLRAYVPRAMLDAVMIAEKLALAEICERLVIGEKP